MGNLKQEWVEYLRDELGRSPRTSRAYLFGLQAVERHTGKAIQEVDSDDLRAFLRGSEVSPATTHLYVTSVRMFHDWGALEGHWERNGIMSVRGKKVNPAPARGLALSQARVLLSLENPRFARLICLGLYAGTRAAESGGITEKEWEDPDTLVFVGKGSKQRVVPVCPELLARRGVILDSPVADVHRQMYFTSLIRRESFYFTSHQLRKTFAQTLYDRDVPFEVVGELLGHAKSVTSVYAHVTEKKLRQAISKLDYGEAT